MVLSNRSERMVTINHLDRLLIHYHKTGNFKNSRRTISILHVKFLAGYAIDPSEAAQGSQLANEVFLLSLDFVRHNQQPSFLDP
jgi:hypothetical protein